MKTTSVLAIAFAIAALSSGSARADLTVCKTLRFELVGNISLSCTILGEKVISITNNSGQAINTSQTPISFDAVSGRDGKRYCGSLKGGVVANGQTVQADPFPARPALSCTARFRNPAVLQRAQ